MTASVTVWIALFSWPVVALIFYRLWNPQVAVVATLICGYLLLPERMGIDLPVLPRLNKDTIPALSALFLVWLASRNAQSAQGMLPGWLPRDKVALGLIGLMLVGAFGTALTNLSPTFNGPVLQPGLQLYDGFSLALRVLVLLVPFLIARKILATPEGQRTLVVFFVGAAVAYAFLALWEVRMSPQLNRQIYGFVSAAWDQHRRAGGFRPLLFLEHGLFVGIFLASAVLLAFGLARAETGRRRALFAAAGIWLAVTILLSKVVGALSIVLLLLPVVLFAARRTQLFVALGLGLIVLTYPMLRNADVIPTTAAVSLAGRISAERADSLAFRFRMEDRLLARAKQRPVFGWGGYGRNEVYDETGRDTTVTDGRWVILFGQGGWVRYLGEFGLLLCGILRLILLPRDRIEPVTVMLAMALTANMVDLLPNAGVSTLTWMMAGALVGRLELRGTEPQKTAEAVPTGRRPLRYARDFGPPKTAREAPSGLRQADRASVAHRPTAGRTPGRSDG
jgi:hypothetical protein